VNGSQQRLELLNGETGVAHDSAHRERVDRIVARNRDDPGTVSHDDVLALACDLKASLFERFHGRKVVDTWYPRHR
jgi:hypothetical protein